MNGAVDFAVPTVALSAAAKRSQSYPKTQSDYLSGVVVRRGLTNA
jgi:hypothetical protein